MNYTKNTSIELRLPDDLRDALEIAATDRLHTLCEEIVLRLERSVLPPKGNRVHSEAELFRMATDVARMAGGMETPRAIVARRKRPSNAK